MNLTIETTTLISALTKIIGVVDRSSAIPVIKNVLIDAQTDRVTIRGTNLDMECLATFEADIAEHGAITVSGLTLLEIVKNLAPGSDLVLSYGADDPRAKLVSGRSRFQLPTHAVVDFPIMRQPEDAITVAMPARDLGAYLGRVAFAMSNEPVRMYLCGVFVHTLDGHVRFVGTQTHRLGLAIGPRFDQEISGAIMPADFVNQAMRILDDGESDARLIVAPNLVSLEYAQARLTSKLIDGTYPEYQRVIPAANPHTLQVGREAMIGAVKRALIMGTSKAQSVKIDFRSDSLAVAARADDSGEALDEISAEFDGEDMRAGFNGTYLLDALAHVETETVEIKVGSPKDALILRAPGDEGALFVVASQRV